MFIGLVEILSSILYLREVKDQLVSANSSCMFCVLDIFLSILKTHLEHIDINSSNVFHILFPETIAFQ